MLNPLELVHIEGLTSIHIDVRVTADGDVLISGHDIGQAPEAAFGREDHEYYLRVASADKDRVILALIEALYAGRPSLMTEIRSLMDSKGIRGEFHSF